jgi:CRISPR/Cas system CSM-associated protein Csm4 (group 5 of RAMP superfamily)
VDKESDRKTTAGDNSVYPKSSRQQGHNGRDKNRSQIYELDTMRTAGTAFLLSSPDENVNTSLLEPSSVYVDKESQTQQDEI